MTNKTTKRALFTSVMSLIICVVMLMGTTFAWFTDSVVSGKNKIVAGNLDVELYYQNDTVTDWTKVGADTNVFKTGTLWEPGHTEVVKLKIVNEGTLALKYLLNLAVVSEVEGVNVDGNKFELSDYIKYGTTTDAVTSRADAIAKVEAGAQALSTEATQGGTLLSKKEKEITLVVYMPETVGNEANYRGDAIPTIDFGVELLATQVENESDSFGIDYDKNAIFYDARVTTDAELLAAIQNANVKVIAVDGDLTYNWGSDSYENSKALLLKGKTVIGFDGNDSINFAGYGSANPIKDVTIKNITVKDSTVGDNENSWEHGYLEFESLTADDVVFASSIMLDGTSVITNSSIDNTVPSWYGAWVNGGNATFKNCSFTGTRAIKLHEAYSSDVVNVTVDGCTFVLSEKPGVVIGTVDADTTVDIKNSAFSTQPGDQGKYIYETDTDVATFNFSESDNVVTKLSTVKVSDAASLKDALTNAGLAGAGNTLVQFETPNAVIDMDEVAWTPVKVDGYNGADIVTIDANGATIKNLSAPLFAGGFAGGSGIVIKNLTIADSDIVSTNTLGSGAFIESVDSMDTIGLYNCHLDNSTVTGGNGSRTGGLIGWTAGYNNVNDGPVKTYVTIEDCSVVGCTITSNGSVGGIYGHAGNNAWTYSTVNNCTVKNCTLNSTDNGGWRVGVVVGTANVGELEISNITESGNTLTQTGKTAPAGQSNLYGRFVPGETGKLVIDGVEIN